MPGRLVEIFENEKLMDIIEERSPQSFHLDDLESLRVALVLLTYNSARFVSPLFDSLSEADGNFALFIVDNSSQDDTVKRVREHCRKFSTFVLVRSRKNLGFSRGNNVGIRLALKNFKPKYVVLLNPDVKVTPDWLRELIKCAEADPKVGIVGSKNLMWDGKTIDSVWHTFDHRTAVFKNIGHSEVDKGQYDGIRDVISVQFSSVLICRELIEDIGLLDEGMFMSNEDCDYCYRAKLYGWKVRYCPESLVYHYAGGSWENREKSWRFHKYSIMHRIRHIVKNYEGWNAIKWTLFSVGDHFLHIIYGGIWLGIIKGRKRQIQQILTRSYSIFWNLFYLQSHVKARIQVQAARRVIDKELFKYSTSYSPPKPQTINSVLE
jgi:GT2 family glycosyltransferase